MAAFFRLPAGPGGTRLRLGIAAFAGVVAPAVAGATLEGDPAHRLGAQLAVGDPGDDAAVHAALARAGAQERQTVLGDCLGPLTSRWLWAPAVVLAAAVFAAAGRRVRRRTGR